jgi:hypothetical protein
VLLKWCGSVDTGISMSAVGSIHDVVKEKDYYTFGKSNFVDMSLILEVIEEECLWILCSSSYNREVQD